MVIQVFVLWQVGSQTWGEGEGQNASTVYCQKKKKHCPYWLKNNFIGNVAKLDQSELSETEVYFHHI